MATTFTATKNGQLSDGSIYSGGTGSNYPGQAASDTLIMGVSGGCFTILCDVTPANAFYVNVPNYGTNSAATLILGSGNQTIPVANATVSANAAPLVVQGSPKYMERTTGTTLVAKGSA